MYETFLWRSRTAWLSGMLFLILAGLAPMVHAADAEDEEEKASRPVLTLEESAAAVAQVQTGDGIARGADGCIKCHDEDSEFPVFDIFKTRHGVAADARTPFAGRQCEACHGHGAEHAKNPPKGTPRAPILTFGAKAWTPPAAQNAACLACHGDHQRIAWKGGAHEFGDVACASCHSVHAPHDPVLKPSTQDQVCYTCHATQRAEFHKLSHHPVGEGKMGCSDCHDPHGDRGDLRQIQASARQACTRCHAEKRGPFLWEHAPAAESCTQCHTPHGSAQPALLVKRSPFLCQECHAQNGHPSLSASGGLAFTSRSITIKGCMNCHSQVHGSNHPSGFTLLR
ncbi:MAG: DmsE family decaheme c-type cytochrome [Magnetococcus sp. WYHC-3]